MGISVSWNCCFAVACGGTCCITLQWASGKFCEHKGMVVPLCSQNLPLAFCEGKKNLGQVVQSILSLTSSLRGQLVKCFTTL